MKFKKLEMDDIDIFKQYNREYGFSTYEYSFLTLYLWRKMLNIEYTFLDGALIIKKHERAKDRGACFMEPLGLKEDKFEGVMEKLNDYSLKGKSFKYLFQDVEFPFLNKLLDRYSGEICFSDDVDNFDYIYDTQELINLNGRKFHKKKNLYNRFTGSYDYKIKDLDEGGVIDHIIKFSEEWYMKRGGGNAELEYELASIREILPENDLFNLKGIAVYVDDRIVGFSIGEIVGDMAIIHIEKGDFDYKGIYAFLNNRLASGCLAQTKYINRQEDLGIKGLRKAKKSYNPIRLERKFVVDFTKNQRFKKGKI